MEISQETRQYRAGGMSLFVVIMGLQVVRILSRLMGSGSSEIGDFFVSLFLDVGLMVVAPILLYTFYCKLKPKEILKLSSIKKPKLLYIPISIILGLSVFVVTIGVSGIWQALLQWLGYTHISDTPLPAKFNPLSMILALVQTALLPGICEEFLMRGALLTTTRQTYSTRETLLFSAILFGLLHANVTQVFYTMFFGALCALLTLKLKTIFPAMIVHIVNNATSVYLQYAESYGFWGGTFFEDVRIMMMREPYTVAIGYVVAVAIAFASVALLFALKEKRKLTKKLEKVKDSGYDVTHKRVVIVGEFDEEKIEDIGLTEEVYGSSYEGKPLFNPKVRDNAFAIGAIVTAILATLFSFIWGLFY